MKSGRFNFHGSEFEFTGDVAVGNGDVFFRMVGDSVVLETETWMCQKVGEIIAPTDEAHKALMMKIIELCGG